jgi:DNA modification methylase
VSVKPWLDDGDVQIHVGDALDVLRGMPDGSVDLIATSPPFYALRDYGVEGQIGLEATPEEWAARLVEVFGEARRVLSASGSMFVECGDSYSAGGLGPGAEGAKQGTNVGSLLTTPKKAPPGHKPKDLIGQPFLLAFALRAAGWYWRGCYPWAKPNAMPESAKDRCTTAHSYVLHFAKNARYFFDGDAISEPAAWERWGDQTVSKYEGTDTATGWMQPKGKNELLGKRTYDGFNARWNEKVANGTARHGTVLDPFGGSGTTALVARKLGRRATLIELNPESRCSRQSAYSSFRYSRMVSRDARARHLRDRALGDRRRARPARARPYAA